MVYTIVETPSFVSLHYILTEKEGSVLMRVNFSKPNITEQEINEVIDTLRSGSIASGKKTKRLENSIATYCGTPNAVCVHTFTEGIERILRLLGIGPWDEVIVPAYMHIAAIFAIERVGARVVVVDTAPGSYTASPEQLIAAVTMHTKAIILSDVGGVMCDYDRIRQALHVKRHMFRVENEQQAVLNRVALISDAAHSFGSIHDSYRSGQSADFTCFSFHCAGNLSAGEGSAIVWRNSKGFENDKLFREENTADTYKMRRPAADGQLTDFVSSLLLSQLSRIDAMIERRLEIVRMYDESLLPIWVQALRHESESYISNGHLYMTRVTGLSEADRDHMIQEMASLGVETRVHFKPLPMLLPLSKMGGSMQAYPNAYQQYANEISLPLHNMLTDEAVAYVADVFKRCIRRGGYIMRPKHKVIRNTI